MNNQKYKFNEPIDIVYLWVDGNDPKWQTLKKEGQERLGLNRTSIDSDANDIRYIEHQELKYSIRSVMKNAPWINRIFIVTNGQVPSWLIQDNSKITIVKHDQIMPADALPTFNSEAIETCLCNIPELSEYFLYANDDMFIGKTVTPDYFFDTKGNPIVRLRKQHWTKEDIESRVYLNNIVHTANIIKTKYGKDYTRYEPIHNIDSYRKSYFKECKQEFSEFFDKTCHCRFKTKNSVQRNIISLYGLTTKKCQLKISRKISKIFKKQEELVCELSPNNAIMKAEIKKYNPTLFCINDGDNTNHTEDCRLKSLLAELFPERQIWEKAEDYSIKPVFTGDNVRTVLFASDNSYCRYFAVALKSLIENSSDNNLYDVIVFESDITRRNKKRLHDMLPANFSLRFIDLTAYIYESQFLNTCPKAQSINTYYKMFIPVLMRDYDKVLYCDSDIVFNGETESLFNIDFEGKQLLAVKDIICLTIFYFSVLQLKENLKLENPKEYFNAGIIMFNIKAINPKEYLESFRKALSFKDLWFQYQDILNIIFNKNYKYISWKWNFQWQLPIYNFNWKILNTGDNEFKTDYWKAHKSPHIIHYSSSVKPWNAPQHEFADVFWHYARQTVFYEEILYANATADCNGRLQRQTATAVQHFKEFKPKKKIYFDYYRCKVLSNLTFGNKKEHYIQKCLRLKERVRVARGYANL